MCMKVMVAHFQFEVDFLASLRRIPMYVGLSGRSGALRRVAAHVVGRLWLSAIIIVFAAAGIACRRQPSGSSGDSSSRREITVSAGASLRDAFGEIGKQYESRTGSKVNFNFGASGALQKQIESGAPVDVFASAGRPQMDALSSQGLIEPGTQRDFARNVLVLVVPADTTSGPTSFTDLGGAKVTRIAVGNPKTVPVGQYAQPIAVDHQRPRAELDLGGNLVHRGDVAAPGMAGKAHFS